MDKKSLHLAPTYRNHPQRSYVKIVYTYAVGVPNVFQPIFHSRTILSGRNFSAGFMQFN